MYSKAEMPIFITRSTLVKFVASYKFLNKLGAGEVKELTVTVPGSITMPRTFERIKVNVEVVDDTSGQLGAEASDKPDEAIRPSRSSKPKSA